ncbi:MAG: aminomethyl-transferring glycine dehydrogenase subunit GcvPB [Eubacteriales bacterium]|nr:aminomethyl-transferring glycine dehydrogenase subunit GcvPB [Eubacteriales bacterium]
MKLIFERSMEGHQCSLVPRSDVPAASLPEKQMRRSTLRLPELSETELSRHYTELSKQAYGVNDGFYPLGSCTMKYNPAVNEEAARLKGFAALHPLQPESTVQGAMEVLYRAEQILCQVTAMDEMTFQPAAGAHGEFTGLLLIKAYHEARKDSARRKIIVPDSAHGTNPASAAMCGFTVVNIPSNAQGGVDIDALRAAVGEDTAGLMLTNPNTLGIFDPNILEITKIVHEAGGLCYYDGANLNAIMGNARPGDMGFDVIHLNLHKTFSTPHGGGGPGSGAVGVKKQLAPYLPAPHVMKTEKGFTFERAAQSLGQVKAFYGNFLVVVRALCYMLMLGGDGMQEASENAVLNANYLRMLLAPNCKVATDGLCMHEFVLDLGEIKKETGVSAMDVAKAMLDEGMHAPTMYFPLIVHEALMFEPTETESKQTLDEAAQTVNALLQAAFTDPERLHNAPSRTPIGRPDDVQAARKPVLRYSFENQ